MPSTTMRQVESLFESVRLAARDAGFPDTGQYVLEAGSKTYGNAYRLWVRDPESGGVSSPAFLSDGFLGMTKNEAWDTLATVRRTLWAVLELRHGRG